MPAWTTAAAIAILGVGALAGLTHAPPGRAGLVAALVPPWAPGGMAAVAASGLPVVDLRWGGHVLILDSGGDPAALAHLRALGFWLVDASGATACGEGGRAG